MFFGEFEYKVDEKGRVPLPPRFRERLKGGIVLAICDELKIPIQFVGVGEKLEDIALFNAETFVEALCS